MDDSRASGQTMLVPIFLFFPWFLMGVVCWFAFSQVGAVTLRSHLISEAGRQRGQARIGDVRELILILPGDFGNRRHKRLAATAGFDWSDTLGTVRWPPLSLFNGLAADRFSPSVMVCSSQPYICRINEEAETYRPASALAVSFAHSWLGWQTPSFRGKQYRTPNLQVMTKR
jgi:hypothetical protein